MTGALRHDLKQRGVDVDGTTDGGRCAGSTAARGRASELGNEFGW